MVIHHFNKLIRNKWVWGVFAVAVSAAFCFDDMFTSSRREEMQEGEAGTLAGEKVSAKTFNAITDDVRGLGRQRDWKRNPGEVNRDAWEIYAALVVANKDGIPATDAEVQSAIRRDPSFQQNGAFSFALYQALLRENSMTPERFEESLKRRITLSHIGQAVLGSAAWCSPMELDRAVSDMTDTFTVKVARFTQDSKDADKVKVGEKEIKKWYDDNVKSLELPERVKIRYVKFNAADPKLLAKMNVTTNEMHDYYDTTIDKYTSTDTNGVEKVQPFEEVMPKIEKELRQVAAVQFYETNLNWRAYSVKAAEGKSRLDEIAKEDGLKVNTSDWFALDGGYSEGFMKRPYLILPGAKNLTESVAELDSSSEDLRYGVVSSDNAVWLIERADESPKHTPTFEEAKKAIEPRVLREAKADAFKASVEAIAKKGEKSVLATKNVSTNITFVIVDLQKGAGSFDDQMAVARAAMKLQKGGVSEFTATGTGRGLLVVCVDRQPGDATKTLVLKDQIREDTMLLQQRQLPVSWQKWNLERMGFVPNDNASVEIVETEE